MSKHVLRALYCGLVSLLAFSYALAQTDRELATAAAGDKYVISAKAGGVNYVEGSVGIVRKNGKSGLLLKRDEVQIGDRVSTGVDGKAEILLNPGSYLRLGPNSAFEFLSTALDDVNIRVDSGSAIFEVYAANEFKVAVITPKSKLYLVESGVYRVDILDHGKAKVEVWRGRAQLGDSTTAIVKTGREAVVSNGTASIVKFDKGEKDAFELWSKDRAKLLAKNVERLRNRDMRTSLMRSFLGRGWGMYNSFGLWVYDASFGGFCFLPFGRGWMSPYGYGYGNSIWWYQLPPTVTVYTPPVTVNPGPVNTPIVSAGDRSVIPPFVRMQQTGSGMTGGTWGGGGFDGGGSADSTVFSDRGGSGRSGGSTPTYVPPPPPPPASDTGAKPSKIN